MPGIPRGSLSAAPYGHRGMVRTNRRYPLFTSWPFFLACVCDAGSSYGDSSRLSGEVPELVPTSLKPISDLAANSRGPNFSVSAACAMRSSPAPTRGATARRQDLMPIASVLPQCRTMFLCLYRRRNTAAIWPSISRSTRLGFSSRFGMAVEKVAVRKSICARWKHFSQSEDCPELQRTNLGPARQPTG